jgi:hypothetical protein
MRAGRGKQTASLRPQKGQGGRRTAEPTASPGRTAASRGGSGTEGCALRENSAKRRSARASDAYGHSHTDSAPHEATVFVPVNTCAYDLMIMPHTDTAHVDVSVVNPAAALFLSALPLGGLTLPQRIGICTNARPTGGAASSTRSTWRHSPWTRTGTLASLRLFSSILLASTTAASGRVSKRPFVAGALRLVSVALCKGNGVL